MCVFVVFVLFFVVVVAVVLMGSNYNNYNNAVSLNQFASRENTIIFLILRMF